MSFGQKLKSPILDGSWEGGAITLRFDLLFLKTDRQSFEI